MKSNILLEFISTERENYDEEDNNRFAFSLGQALRYYEFILIIAERHEVVSQEMLSNIKKLQAASSEGDGVMSHEHISFLEEQRRLSTLVHLEIESFYEFAKILLDKLALFLQDYFGQVRGCSLASHDKLTKNYERFGSAKELILPKAFSENLTFLKEILSDFRDKQISHLKNPRAIKATGFDDSGQTRIIVTHLYPNERELEREQIGSTELPELMQAIDLYLKQVIEIVLSNRDKTRFKVKNNKKTQSAAYR